MKAPLKYFSIIYNDIYDVCSRGAVPEDRAALLASKGFVTLALAFFGVDQLPKVIITTLNRKLSAKSCCS